MKDDFLTEFMRAVLVSQRTDEELRRIELDLRRHWGGERFYLQKAVTAPKVSAFVTHYTAGASLRQSANAAGLSLRTGYRLIRRSAK